MNSDVCRFFQSDLSSKSLNESETYATVALQMSVYVEETLDTLRHSRLGIVSTIIGAALPVLLVIFVAIALIFGTSINSTGNYIGFAGLIFSVFAPLLHFIGAGLGIGGLFTKNTKKVFPVVGTILNIMLGISGVLLWVLVISSLSFGFR